MVVSVADSIGVGTTITTGHRRSRSSSRRRIFAPATTHRLRTLLAAGGRWFFPFARLTVIAATLYYAVFRIAGWFFPWLERATRDLTRETTVLALNLAAAAVVVAFLAVIRMAVDYGRISMVVGSRHGALGAFAEGLSFVARRPFAAPGLVVVFTLVTAAFFVLYAVAAPGATQSSPLAILGGLAVGQRCVWHRRRG